MDSGAELLPETGKESPVVFALEAAAVTILSAGSKNQKVEPSPSAEKTPISPPSRSMMLLLIASPNPVPCAFLLSLTNRSNTLFVLLAGMPHPVSST